MKGKRGMSFRSSYWKTRLALTGRKSAETLTAMEGYFQGGKNWAQGVYHAPDGRKCLVGAADHLRASSVDTAKYWLERAIAEQTGGTITRIESFNDSRRSYREIAAIVSRAQELAAHYAQQSPPSRGRPALTHQPDERPVVEVTMSDLERVAVVTPRRQRPSNFHD
jgi:hypothetical protein